MSSNLYKFNSYLSATKPNRLMLYWETIALYWENHTEHTDTVCTSQQTHYVSATYPNQLMLYRETAAVYCENHTEHKDTLCGQNAEFQYVKAGGIYKGCGKLTAALALKVP
jgi:predicted Zn-dependent protease with MMP-like domain